MHRELSLGALGSAGGTGAIEWNTSQLRNDLQCCVVAYVQGLAVCRCLHVFSRSSSWRATQVGCTLEAGSVSLPLSPASLQGKKQTVTCLRCARLTKRLYCVSNAPRVRYVSHAPNDLSVRNIGCVRALSSACYVAYVVQLPFFSGVPWRVWTHSIRGRCLPRPQSMGSGTPE